jgi:hypothetical protein
MGPTHFKTTIMVRNLSKKTIPVLLFISLLILLSIEPLLPISFSANSGYAIPLGEWSTYHNPSPFFSLGADFVTKRFFDAGLQLCISSFSGKFNSNYTLQVLSPGISATAYPLIFINNRNLFLRNTLTYSYLLKNIHGVRENGGDFMITSQMGGKFIFNDTWALSIFIGENHYFGGLDHISFGMGVEFKK